MKTTPEKGTCAVKPMALAVGTHNTIKQRTGVKITTGPVEVRKLTEEDKKFIEKRAQEIKETMERRKFDPKTLEMEITNFNL